MPINSKCWPLWFGVNPFSKICLGFVWAQGWFLGGKNLGLSGGSWFRIQGFAFFVVFVGLRFRRCGIFGGKSSGLGFKV